MCEIEEQPSMANKHPEIFFFFFRSHQVSARHFNETKQVRDSQPIKPNQESQCLTCQKGQKERNEKHADAA